MNPTFSRTLLTAAALLPLTACTLAGDVRAYPELTPVQPVVAPTPVLRKQRQDNLRHG